VLPEVLICLAKYQLSNARVYVNSGKDRKLVTKEILKK
jgi:hypothetical protein